MSSDSICTEGIGTGNEKRNGRCKRIDKRMKVLILFCGLYNIVFALFHMVFWRLFNWSDDLKKLSFANRGIMQILNIQLIFYFLFVAVVCFAFPLELVETKFGNVFLLGNSLFWLIRTVQQFVFLRANHRFIHLLTVLFMIGTILFAWPLLMR